jgi:flagellar hook-length control protein FliK
MEKEATTIPEESIPTAETAQSIIDQMTESILTKKTDEGTVMQLRLKPEFLGEVTIRLEETKSGITANIVAEKEIVKTLLGQSNEELTALLAEKNIKIDQLIIESKDMTANHGEDQFSEETFNDFSDNENRREQRETPYSQRGELDTISMEDHKNSEKRIMKEGLNLYI